MVDKIKRSLYFIVSEYFRFFAAIRLKKWNPTIIVVTGSSGKTTLMHMLEAQIGVNARYTHHANSAIGIPFDILGLHRDTLLPREWPGLFLKAPILAFKPPPSEKLYIVEADCDRPGEGKFVAQFLKPHITIWLNSTRTHSMNFDNLVRRGVFSTIDEAITHEFGYFVEYAQTLAIVNADSKPLRKELIRTHASVKYLNKPKGKHFYQVHQSSTVFTVENDTFELSGMLPPDAWYGVAATLALLNHLHLPIDPTFTHFHMPPGRGRVFKGIKGTTLVDSSYNANYSSMVNMLETFRLYEAKTKWLVLGDMLEQGSLEREEHEKLVKHIRDVGASTIICYGPRFSQYVVPLLASYRSNKQNIVSFQTPKEVLEYIRSHMKGEETILFKGWRLLEGVIEHLLKDTSDTQFLCRREYIWQIRRKKAGL